MDDWTRLEVEAVVEDYLAMLSAELSGTPYNKSAHRRALLLQLNNRSESSVEFKHANSCLQTCFPCNCLRMLLCIRSPVRALTNLWRFRK